METKNKNYWWLKTPGNQQDKEENILVPKLDLSTSSLVSLLEDKNDNFDSDVDVGSIIEEINRVAAKSPLGPYEKSIGDRSIGDIIKEAEKIYQESSKSFEQLSQRSKTSQNLSDLFSNTSRDSTPTPKSISPLPMDPEPLKSTESDDDYTEDFSEESKIESAQISPTEIKLISSDNTTNKEVIEILKIDNKENISENIIKAGPDLSKKFTVIPKSHSINSVNDLKSNSRMISKSQSAISNLGNIISQTRTQSHKETICEFKEQQKIFEFKQQDENSKTNQNIKQVESREILIENLEKNNDALQKELQQLKLELQKTQSSLEQTRAALSSKHISSPEVNLELGKVIEDLKDSKEKNTSLQLQLDTVNKSHQLLKSSYDDVLSSNKNLERRVIELDSTLEKYKNEILTLQQFKDKLVENEANLNKLLEMEKLQNKSIKLQNEKDAKCIQDLNRQIKEMERIIARKHPDSVSALIVAAKENATDNNLTARKILEDRIKTLEQEQQARETHSSKVFIEIQEKFNQMKDKYENHIEDLELHVKDLKNQLKRKRDTYDIYTQTNSEDKIPQKESFTTFTQTDPMPAPIPTPTTPKIHKPISTKKNEDSHLLATIRGLQSDLTNKEKLVHKLQKEIDDLKKTNKRLQKEREGSLKSLLVKKETKNLPEKLLKERSNSEKDFEKEESIINLKSDREVLQSRLNRLQDEYQSLQNKRIKDLTALQEAHEKEIANYIGNINPLREQLEIHQLSINSLQSQLSLARDELQMVKMERENLIDRLNLTSAGSNNSDESSLLEKIGYLEKQYIDHEHRLRSMIQQSNLENQNCEQCLERQQQLIDYKTELDEVMSSVLALQ